MVRQRSKNLVCESKQNKLQPPLSKMIEENNKAYRQEFNTLVKDIRKLTFDSLGKFEKVKIKEMDRLVTGRKPDKSRKMPITELRFRRCAAERAIAKQLQHEEELGVKMYHGKKTLHQASKEKRLKLIAKKGFKEKRSLESMSNVGREKNGHLRVSSEFIKKYSSTS